MPQATPRPCASGVNPEPGRCAFADADVNDCEQSAMGREAGGLALDGRRADGLAAGAPDTANALKGITTSDEALMLAYRNGDENAFEILYRRHRGGLYRYLLRHCHPPAVAQELFQDVWVNLIGARGRYTVEARFTTYLYRIAHNRLIDHFRRSAHRPFAGSTDEPELECLVADARQQPEARVEAAARIDRFMAVLNSLPEAQREAFVLHAEAGMSIEAIATATGVGFETAKSRLRYAVAKLRQGLQGYS